MAASTPEQECVYSACLCCFTACKKTPLCGCRGESECLCCLDRCCVSLNGQTYKGFPCSKEEGECALSAPCCQCGLRKPRVCCSSNGEFCCMRSAAAFPPADPVPNMVCAVCFLRCCPGPVGCCKPPLETMER
eukprot:GFYU01000951.1.p1 GENE.GFYU01000951.1~~GFYU01000951.1.p1  ORF type:complete len:147 (-),score=26.32 GFYU01000951.1:124-522(-)